ncbi:hypothetical protein H310_15054 [Aphanomyces invadans]|uniref:Uncharacterized protein n=1 Tax=Aphanomyces invadans TaxID=157072 RepID=A0A024T7V8_9STRA|nr:hypothetical protein H310_15054 [Aphanomyces invadans]ETV90115.1 hypothetical protein H310_15054 [Aphanomyces invadans]|eukprot:XP_008881254.1 hypothetical protein H310_15054 [Aphanomyces invadans]
MAAALQDVVSVVVEGGASMTPMQVFGCRPVAERDLIWTERSDLWLSSTRTFAGVTRNDAARVTERMARLREMSDYVLLDAISVGTYLKMLRSGGHEDLERHILWIVCAFEQLWVAVAQPLVFTAFKGRMKAQCPGWVVDMGLIARRGDETMLEYISIFVFSLVGRGRGGRNGKWPTTTTELANALTNVAMNRHGKYHRLQGAVVARIATRVAWRRDHELRQIDDLIASTERRRVGWAPARRLEDREREDSRSTAWAAAPASRKAARYFEVQGDPYAGYYPAPAPLPNFVGQEEDGEEEEPRDASECFHRCIVVGRRSVR